MRIREITWDGIFIKQYLNTHNKKMLTPACILYDCIFKNLNDFLAEEYEYYLRISKT